MGQLTETVTKTKTGAAATLRMTAADDGCGGRARAQKCTL